MSRRKEPVIPSDLLDQLLAGGDAAAALQQGGLLDSLKKALAERALIAEMDHHLGHEAASELVKSGGDLLTRSEILGGLSLIIWALLFLTVKYDLMITCTFIPGRYP